MTRDTAIDIERALIHGLAERVAEVTGVEAARVWDAVMSGVECGKWWN
jgi:hypothetical protein